MVPHRPQTPIIPNVAFGPVKAFCTAKISDPFRRQTSMKSATDLPITA
jgi:hypothetical protein